jgi:tetrahydromethanopterin S-methyltransferase subunit E
MAFFFVITQDVPKIMKAKMKSPVYLDVLLQHHFRAVVSKLCLSKFCVQAYKKYIAVLTVKMNDRRAKFCFLSCAAFLLQTCVCYYDYGCHPCCSAV